MGVEVDGGRGPLTRGDGGVDQGRNNEGRGGQGSPNAEDNLNNTFDDNDRPRGMVTPF